MNNFSKEINEILKNSGTLILEEDDSLPEWVVETKELIKKFEEYGHNDFDQGRNIVAQIMTICHYIDTAHTSDSYKKLCQKIVDYTDNYKAELVGEALGDDDNAEYRSPNSDEVDWDLVSDYFYSELNDSPLELFNSYSGTTPREFVEDIAKICKDYLSDNIEGIEQYSGEDTELDESVDQDVELTQRIKALYGYCTDLLNTGVLRDFDYDRQAERAFLNVYNEASKLIEFTDLYSFIDSTIMDMKQAYEEDSDNWRGDVIDDDATYMKCVNMSFDDLVDYSNSNNRREYVNNIKEVIYDYFEYDDYNEEPNEYTGDDTELDESLILEDDEDEEGWEEDSPIINILKICNSISVEEDIHSLEQYADELYNAIYNALSDDPSEKYKKLYSKLEDIANDDFYQGLRESAWDDGDNSQYRDATPEDEEWDKAMDSFYEDWGDMPDYIISQYYNYDVSDIIGDLRTLINDEFPDVQDIYAQDNQDMIDESLEDETELEQVKGILAEKDNVNRRELKFIINWCETCENSEIMRYIEEVRDYCMDSYITQTTYESVYDDDATSDYIYNLDTSDLISRYATSSEIEEFADKVHNEIIDYLGFNPLNSDGSVRDEEYNGDDTELDEAFDPNNPYQMGLYSLRSQIITLNNMAESDHYSMKERAYECYEKIKELDDKYGDKELIKKLSDIAFHYYFMLTTIGDDIFDNTKFDKEYLIKNASEETIKQFSKVLMTCLNEIDFNIEGIDISNYNGEDTELDESLILKPKKVTYETAPNFIKDMMTPIAKVGDIFKSIKLPNDNYPFKNTNNDLNWQVINIENKETDYALYIFNEPIYTLECIDADKKPIICNNSELKNLFKKEENNKVLYTGEDTELDESVEKDNMIGKDYRHNGFGSLYYIDGVDQNYYHLKKARKNDSGQSDLFIQKDKLNKYFTKVENNYDGSETELDESKKELSAIDLLIKTHKKYPEKDVTEIAQEIVKGNIEEYISLMKEYYRRFEK